MTSRQPLDQLIVKQINEPHVVVDHYEPIKNDSVSATNLSCLTVNFAKKGVSTFVFVEGLIVIRPRFRKLRSKVFSLRCT